ncbi:MAG: hypothetical protein LBH43_16235 [Treponema sp.]|jgi:hypothetical protein|nr:hypothetical protein [Treponema sp.]
MPENIEFKKLSLDDINDNLLDSFNRYQKVNRYWHNDNGKWTLIDGEYIEDWDKNKKDSRIKYFSDP